jgi:hypothetical protein
MPLYLAFRGRWLDLAYGVSGVCVSGPKLWFHDHWVDMAVAVSALHGQKLTQLTLQSRYESHPLSQRRKEWQRKLGNFFTISPAIAKCLGPKELPLILPSFFQQTFNGALHLSELKTPGE